MIRALSEAVADLARAMTLLARSQCRHVVPAQGAADEMSPCVNCGALVKRPLTSDELAAGIAVRFKRIDR